MPGFPESVPADDLQERPAAPQEDLPGSQVRKQGKVDRVLFIFSLRDRAVLDFSKELRFNLDKAGREEAVVMQVKRAMGLGRKSEFQFLLVLLHELFEAFTN